MESPCAKTTQGLFPILECISRDDPNPNVARPKHRKNKVLKLGLKFSGAVEDQSVVGISLIFRNMKIAFDCNVV